MKQPLLILFASLFLLNAVPATASHVIGLQISYEYTGTGSNYIFRAKMYRDCAGISAPSSLSVQFNSVACGSSFSALLPSVSTVQVPMNSCAGVGPSYCQGGNIFGFEEITYEGLVSVLPCPDWIVSSNICCRNNGVSNIVNGSNYSTYVETRFDNLNFPGNSSPQYNATPVSYYCVGIPSLKDYSTIDPDGDSIRYELVPVLDNATTSLPYAPGYSANQPLATFTGTVLDSLSGMLLFNPSQIQVSVVGVLISEYRNGALIGTIRVDDEIVVTTGNANPDTISGRVYVDNNSNGVFDGGDMPVQNTSVGLTPGNLVTSTMSNGKYDLFVVDGNWNVTVPNPPTYYTVSPASINVNTNGITYSGGNDFILAPTPNINDLEVTLNGTGNPVPGQLFQLFANYENVGTTVQNGVDVTITLDPLLQYVNAAPAPTNIAGNTLTWTFASIPVFGSGIIHISTEVDTTATIGTPVICTATISSAAVDFTPANNTDTINKIVAAAYDPNYKEVSPAGDLPLAFVASQNWMTYKIHFQNLGTAPAQIVRIVDLIDPDLEISTLEYIASSFPCSVTLTSPNQAEFRFTGINLQAASVNEPASHGFVEYRIKPKSNLQPGTYITNYAGIYFDFAAPIYTNMVQNKVVTSSGIFESSETISMLSLYPNPATNQSVLEFNSKTSGNVKIELYNFIGATVKQQNANVTSGLNQINLSVADLPAGNYFIMITDENQTRYSRLSVVKR